MTILREQAYTLEKCLIQCELHPPPPQKKKKTTSYYGLPCD